MPRLDAPTLPVILGLLGHSHGFPGSHLFAYPLVIKNTIEHFIIRVAALSCLSGLYASIMKACVYIMYTKSEVVPHELGLQGRGTFSVVGGYNQALSNQAGPCTQTSKQGKGQVRGVGSRHSQQKRHVAHVKSETRANN